jgi:putative phosphoribosyl transferase
MGAIGEGGARVLNTAVIGRGRISDDDLAAVEQAERSSIEARVARYRRGRARVDLGGRVAVVVDDGVATGSTARAACAVARELGAARVVLAVPVGPARTLRDFADADRVVCVSAVSRFLAVGYHYADFSATTGQEVIALLDAAARRVLGGPPGGAPRR